MRVRIGLTLLVVIFLVGSLPIPSSSIFQIDDSSSPISNSMQNISPSPNNHLIAAHSESGILDPLTIEQRGNWTTQIIPADSSANTGMTSSLEVDTANDWVGSEAYVNLWNLERLYIANGSLDDGITGQNTNPTGNAPFAPYGWDAISYSSDGTQQMIAEYTPTQDVVVRSKGPGTPGNYQFRDGSYVYWVQNVTNTPHLDQFIFSLDYSYDKGPLYENVTLRVLANDTLIWNVTANNLEVGVPYSTGDLLLDFTGFSGQFEFKIGLYFNGNVTHSQQFIEFTLDNIRLVGQTPPGFDDLDIDFHINSIVADVTGTSLGTATISNSSLWTTDVPIELTSTLPVSFDYNASILNHRYMNSSYELNPSSQGVSFVAGSQTGVSLDLYSYYGSLSALDNFSIIIYYPKDWENVTVLNPFLTDVTSNCFIHSDFVRIPSDQLYTLGWWEITLDASNYLKTLSSEKSATGTDPWTDHTVFNTSEYIRASTSIGLATENPIVDDGVNISLYLPNGTLWWSEVVTGGSGEILNATGIYLDSSNTSAGEWIIAAFWQNGTEVAYGEILFEVHHQSELVPVESIIETESGAVVTNLVRYRDTESNEYISGPGTSVVANWSSSTIVFVHNPVQNAYEADFNTSEVGSGIFIVRVNATSPYHDDATTTFDIMVIVTNNVLTLSDNTGETNLETNYTAVFTYLDSYGAGIESANVNISYTGPTNGLTWFVQEDLGLGSYQMNFKANITGSYIITITGWKSYFESADDTLFLLVGEYGSQISSPNGTADAISFGNSYNYVFLYQNSTGYGLSGASVSIVSVTPETGLLNESIIDEGNGYYSVNLTPQQTGVFTILFKAEILNHETQFISFTLTATVIGTQLTVEASADLTVVGDPIYFTLNFTNEVGEGIENANISVVDPPTGLTIPPVVELGGGLYQYTITATSGGAYQLRFKANATNHIDATAAYSFLVGLYTSELTSLNGTSGTIGYNQQYHLVVEFTNSSGYGLTGGTVDITNIVPATGLSIDDKIDNLDGTYSILLTPITTGIFTFQIEVSKAQYETQIISFTLTSPVIGSSLTIDASSDVIAVGGNITITFTYTNETSDGIVGASITLISQASGLVFSDLSELGNGLYSIVVTTTEVNEYQLRFLASATNHLNATSALTLSVTLAPTSLVIETPLLEYTAFFGSYLELPLYYLELNYIGEAIANISNADISVSAVDDEGFTYSWVFENNRYILRLAGESLGIWELTITVSKEGYATDVLYLDFRVRSIETTVNEFTPAEYYIGRTYTITLLYQLTNGSGIEDAVPVPNGRGSDWMNVIEIGDGAYNVTFSPTEEGNYTVFFEFSKTGYESKSARVSFDISPVPIRIIPRTSSWNQSSVLIISATVVEVDTEAPVLDAIVTCELSYGGSLLEVVRLDHVDSGLYEGSPTVGWPGSGEIIFKFSVEKDNFQDTTFEVSVYGSPMSPEDYFFTFVLPQLIVVTVLGAIVAGSYRINKRRQLRIRRELAEIKSTFDDANNLLGILILHKNSGLPFYSKILKGGFEEGMLSAFVTAVTHFRSEFEQNGADRQWKLTPISDIIRAGPTRNLICAFVTMTSPSLVHEAKMLTFTRDIGLLLDDQMEVPPTEFRDDEIGKKIEKMFDDYLDGYLLKEYRFSVEGALPRRFKILSEARAIAGIGDIFFLAELNRGLEAMGIEGPKGLKLLFDAVEDGQLWPIQKDELEEMLSDFSPPPEVEIEDNTPEDLSPPEDSSDTDSFL